MDISAGTKNIQHYYNWLQENIFKGQTQPSLASQFELYCTIVFHSGDFGCRSTLHLPSAGFLCLPSLLWSIK